MYCILPLLFCILDIYQYSKPVEFYVFCSVFNLYVPAVVDSFLDDAFRKDLESALRFGNPLLVQDVESYDPILNPVLNRELRRTGGRVLITLGDQDIDLSPSFTIFLSTRDPTVRIGRII